MLSIAHYAKSASVLTIALAMSFSSSAIAHKYLTPLPGQHGHVGPIEAPYIAPGKAKSGTWAKVKNAFPGGTPDTALVLTDGTVLMHDGCTANWYRLTPDSKGSYHNGTWKKTAAMPSGYTPLYFASQVLADGRVIVNGGEYLNCSAVWTTKGALYDPVADSWTNVNPPSGWANIGDAQSVVRTDKTYMLANCCSTQEATAAISGTTVTWTATGTGKADSNDEEGWTLLPDETILTVDANRDLTSGHNDVEIYSASTGAWTAGTPTPNAVVDSGSHEIGPAPLLPNGLVFQTGATANNDVYDPLTAKWTKAPSFMGGADSADGPAVVLPSGNVLAQVSPGVFQSPSHFFEVTVKSASNVTITQVNDPATAPNQSSYEGRLVMLPSGEALWSSDVGDVEIYTPQGKAAKGSAPVIKKVPATLTHGSANNVITGKGFNGLTFGGYYGDDAQMSTNFPIVRITNAGSGDVCYARTHDHATMGISDGTPTSTKFDVPSGCETGASTVEVIANGVASKPKSVTVN